MKREVSEHTKSTTKLLVVDDNVFNRRGMHRYLKQKGFRVLEAGDEATGWQIAIAHTPAAAIIDISIPPSPQEFPRTQYAFGVRLAQRLKESHPTIGIVLFSAYEDRGRDVLDMIRAGKRGLAYKLKGCSPADLLNAIHAVLAGQVVIDPEVQADAHVVLADVIAQLTPEERLWVERALSNLERLTPREQDVVDRLAASYNTAGIAEALGINTKTAENHIGHVYEKLGLNEMVEKAPRLRQAVVLAKACLIRDLKLQRAK